MTAVRRLHISNSASRNAVIVASSPSMPPPPTMGKNGQPATFRRFISAGDGRLDPDLAAEYGADYSQALMDGDPEIDFHTVGRFVEATQTVMLTDIGEPIFTAPHLVEITYGPDGSELDRKEPTDTAATVNDVIPLRWTGRKMPIAEVVRKFAFRRSLQLRHVDGVTFDFLFAMAKELADEQVMVLLGAGESGKEPLILQLNGSPYRGFLEGRIHEDGFLLLLHLSNMELKKPAAAEQGGEE